MTCKLPRFFLSLPILWCALHLQAADYALSAPERAHIRQTIEVGWIAPQAKGGMLEIRALDNPEARVSYAYITKNPQAILAPEALGDYVLVMVFQGEDRDSQPLTIFMPEASLEAPANLDAGSSFDVAWEGPENRQDRITIAEHGGGPIRGTSYTYVGNTRGGPARLKAPMDPGDYDVVYVSGATILARTRITVGAVSATLRHEPSVHAGGELRVTWEGPRNAQDRVTFARPDGDPLPVAAYAYVANADDSIVVLRAPAEAGALDVVYLSGGRVIGRSPVAVVDARVELEGPGEAIALAPFQASWRGDGNRGDRVVVRDGSGSDLAYSYIRLEEPETRLVAPAAPGNYRLVYVTRDGREMAEQPIRVLAPPTPPGTLLVENRSPVMGPEDAVGVILDASGSMLQRIEGVPRIEIARETLRELIIDTIPRGTGFALRVFGHREAESCRTDLEVPLGPLDPASATSIIQSVNARNLARTPLGQSIALARSDLAGVSGTRLLVVLTDGEETCEGDPAASIMSLRDLGWDITVNIVGFAIEDKALQAEFAAWAELGGGAYFSAADRESLHEALTRAVASVDLSILDADGRPVVEGRTGEIITLPAGDYTIRWGSGQQRLATVSPGELTRVGLEKSSDGS